MGAEDLSVSPVVNQKTLIPDSPLLAPESFVLGKMAETFWMPKFCPLKVDQTLLFLARDWTLGLQIWLLLLIGHQKNKGHLRGVAAPCAI